MNAKRRIRRKSRWSTWRACVVGAGCLVLLGLVAACGGPTPANPTSSVRPSSAPPQSPSAAPSTAPAEVEIRKRDIKAHGVEVDDVLLHTAKGNVAAFIVLPKTKPTGLIVYLHWLSNQPIGDRREFLDEAVARAPKGAAGLLLQGTFPWAQQPSGADADAAAIRSGVDAILASISTVRRTKDLATGHLEIVGHDFGAMYAPLVAAQLSGQSEFDVSRIVLMAPSPKWANWLLGYWEIPGDPAAYRAKMSDLDPVSVLPSLVGPRILLQLGQLDRSFVPDADASALKAALPKNAKAIEYDVSHDLSSAAASADRDKWLLEGLGS